MGRRGPSALRAPAARPRRGFTAAGPAPPAGRAFSFPLDALEEQAREVQFVNTSLGVCAVWVRAKKSLPPQGRGLASLELPRFSHLRPLRSTSIRGSRPGPALGRGSGPFFPHPGASHLCFAPTQGAGEGPGPTLGCSDRGWRRGPRPVLPSGARLWSSGLRVSRTVAVWKGVFIVLRKCLSWSSEC